MTHLESPYERFLQWILQNPGFQLPQPKSIFDRRREQSEPGDEVVARAVAVLISAVTSKAAAANMTNQAAARQISAAADETIATFLDSDDICPRWPFPGPPPWLSIIASELTLAANLLQPGAVQAGILQVAGQVLDRAVALGAGAAGDTGLTRAA